MSVVDDEVLSMLKEVMADEFPVLLDTFITDARQRISQLESFVQEREWELIRGNAHSLKGSSSNIGATDLSEVSLLLEQRGREQSDEGIDQLVVDLKSSYQEVEKALNNYLS